MCHILQRYTEGAQSSLNYLTLLFRKLGGVLGVVFKATNLLVVVLGVILVQSAENYCLPLPQNSEYLASIEAPSLIPDDVSQYHRTILWVSKTVSYRSLKLATPRPVPNFHGVA